jgi:hypothetical protein
VPKPPPPPGPPTGADARRARCGAALPARPRRRSALCRVCATRDAQAYLRQALAARRAERRRPRPAGEDGATERRARGRDGG